MKNPGPIPAARPSILALAVLGIATSARADVRTVHPDVGPDTVGLLQYQASGYKVLVLPPTAMPPSGFEQPGFDDSSFSPGTAAFGSGGNCPLESTVQTNWPVTSQLLVRRSITIPAGMTGVRVMISIDNDVLRAFWNGTEIANGITHEDCSILDEFRVEVPQGLIQTGENLLALQVIDRGDQTFFDTRVLGECAGGAAACVGVNNNTSNHNASKLNTGFEVGASIPQLAIPSSAPISPTAGKGSPNPLGTVFCSGSYVDNLRWNHVQESVDYATTVKPEVEGCASCGANQGKGVDLLGDKPGKLTELEIRRYHRPRQGAVWSSFGPGVFSSFDTKIHLIGDGFGAQPNIDLFDAESDLPPLTFFERSSDDGDNNIDGLYHDTEARLYKTIELLDRHGHRTADQTRAATAVLTKWTGERWVFEVFRNQAPSPGMAPAFDGRLARTKDRNNNAVRIKYRFSADARDDECGFDRTRLWQIASVTDMYGVSAQFDYASHRVAGRWAVERIKLPNGGELKYRYRDSLSSTQGIGPFLKEVEHPDGTKSQFRVIVDSATGLVVVEYDDSAGGPSQARKKVFLTPATAATPSLVRRVVNGDGELVYQNWEDPGDSNTNYFYEGGVLTRIILGNDGFPHSYSRAVSYTAGQDPRTALFDVIETYQANGKQMLTGRVDALARGEALTRDPLTRAVLGVGFADSSTSTATYNQFLEPLHVADRLGRITDRSYDARGNLLSTTVAVGTPVQAIWREIPNGRGQPIAQIDANNNRTDYTYSGAGRLVEITEPADGPGEPRARRTFGYDGVGRLSFARDAEGRTIQFDYDRRNRVTAVCYADESCERLEYGRDGLANLLVERKDRNGNRQTFEYDRTKRLVVTTMAAGKPEAVKDTFRYAPGTSLVASQTRRGERTDFERDGRNRVVASKIFLPAGRSLTIAPAYDVLDRVVRTTDPYGRAAFFLFDINDYIMRTVSELVPGGVPATANLETLVRDASLNPPYVISEAVFDSMGQMTKTTDGRANSTTMLYDQQGRETERLEAAATPVAALTRREYDSQGNLTRIKHPRTFSEGQPFVTEYTYTGRNLQRSSTVAAGRPEAATVTSRYTLPGKIAETIDARGNHTRFRYDPCCDRLIETVDPTGATTRFDYDSFGNRTLVLDANGNATRFTYDGLHRIASQTNGEDETTRFQYDNDLRDGRGLDSRFHDKVSDLGFSAGADGMAILATNPLDETTLTISDGLSRTLRTVDGNGNPETTTYDILVGSLVETARIDALGHTSRVRHDALGRPRQRIDAEAQVTAAMFDAAGNRAVIRDPNDVGDDCIFDARNRATACRDTKNDLRQRQYDAHSNQVAMIDGLGVTTANVFDARDRKMTTTDRLGGVTNYAYDKNSNLLRITDAEGNPTAYEYDSRNLKTKETFPASPGAGPDQRTMTYDPGRRVASRTDQAGATVTYQYDRADRLARRKYPDHHDDTFTYDRASRMTSARSDRYGTLVQRQYDRGGRTTEDKQSVLNEQHGVRYTYDAANRQTRVTYPNGSVVMRTFTDRDQMATVSLDGSAIAARTYDQGMRLMQTTLGNGRVESRGYGTDNTVASLNVPGVTDFSYAYDANKWKQEEATSTSGGSQSFRYDTEGRVTSWNRASGDAQTWNLSLVGDWQQTQRDASLENRSHNPVHELTAINGTPLSYDAKGNLTRDDRGNRYSWDFENRLFDARMAGPHGAQARYFYDALGRRLGKSAGGRTTVYVHDGQQVVAEYDNRALTRRYVFGPYIDEPLALKTGAGIFFYTSNHLYSVAALSDAGGSVVERYTYDAYGDRAVIDTAGALRISSAFSNQIGFTGRYCDPDSGLVNFRSRQYDPRLGRFIGRDGAYVDGMSLYAAYFVPNAADPFGTAILTANSGCTPGQLIPVPLPPLAIAQFFPIFDFPWLRFFRFTPVDEFVRVAPKQPEPMIKPTPQPEVNPPAPKPGGGGGGQGLPPPPMLGRSRGEEYDDCKDAAGNTYDWQEYCRGLEDPKQREQCWSKSTSGGSVQERQNLCASWWTD